MESDSQNLRPDASLPEAKATYRISGVMAGDFLNMRQGPGINYPVIQRLQNGVDGVTLIGNPTGSGKKKWQKIKSRGVVGWVNADYLTSSSDSQNTKAVAPNANGR
ncbi:MAG: SH3 domain-containing protein [Terrimicrobiaceae bacterium]